MTRSTTSNAYPTVVTTPRKLPKLEPIRSTLEELNRSETLEVQKVQPLVPRDESKQNTARPSFNILCFLGDVGGQTTGTSFAFRCRVLVFFYTYMWRMIIYGKLNVFL